MRSQGLEPGRVHDKALKCSITPDGTLFIIHTYPQADFDAADIQTRAFEHYPLPKGVSPPAAVDAKLIAIPFLLATKLWESQRLGRGGERPKDAYDLARCPHLTPVAHVMKKLAVYVGHQGRAGDEREIARRTSVYLDYYSEKGYDTFASWSKRFVPRVCS